MSHKNVAWKNDVAQKNDVNGTKCRTEKRTNDLNATNSIE